MGEAFQGIRDEAALDLASEVLSSINSISSIWSSDPFNVASAPSGWPWQGPQDLAGRGGGMASPGLPLYFRPSCPMTPGIRHPAFGAGSKVSAHAWSDSLVLVLIANTTG